MTKDSRLFLLAFLVIAAGAVIYYTLSSGLLNGLLGQSFDLTPLSPESNQAAAVLPATGNIDAAVDSLLREVVDESSAIADLETNVDLISEDSQQIKNFGQSIDDEEF